MPFVKIAAAFSVMFGALLTPAMAQRNAPLNGQAGDVWRSKRYTPAQVPDVNKMTAAERGRVVLDGYANCVVRASPRKVTAMLAMPMHSAEAEAASRRLTVDDCLSGGDLTFDTDVLRGSLYRALYRYEFATNDSKLQPLSMDTAFNAKVTAQPNYDPLRRFSECVVRDNAVASRDLVMAAAASTIEQSAFAQLKTSFSTCMAKGSEVRFSKTVLVGLIAEMLYRLSSPILAAGSK
jgi:hypothetical protein